MQFRIADLTSLTWRVRVSNILLLVLQSVLEVPEVIVRRITLPVAHRRPLQFIIKSGADLFSFQVFVNSIHQFSAVVGVTDCHDDDGRRIADR